ncbi:MAG: helix-turn-helix domain-containing protein, partial [Chlorobium sp.]
MRKYYTTEEAAHYLGVSSARIRQYILEERLQTDKSGRDHLIAESVLAEFARFGRKKVGRPFHELYNPNTLTV